MNGEARLIPTQPTLVKSAILEHWLALLDEGGHAFLLIRGREQRVKKSPLEAHAFGERGLERAVDRLFGGEHRGTRETRDLRGNLERLCALATSR